MVSSVVVVAVVGALLVYWAVRGPRAGAERPLPVVADLRPRPVPVGTVRVETVPGRGPRWLQLRAVRRAITDHRVRGWVLLGDPRPPLGHPEDWTLTFQKVGLGT